ncbi:hypothetical protein NDU88_006228 [Pleurodeles waltl]|uniref:Murine leukemia virus integrase C-terminal domain-containing protein n=1 Tax=Pleurodeles waltl TaxID=8319 RepID=A0AAV7N3G3_PLEWA|nr:hypothetical protein NDU88_006228 [Pleurodeles waltl]
MRLPAVPAHALVNITDDMVLYYCKGLTDVVRSFSLQAEATTLPPIHDPGHNLRAGDWVVVRKHVRKTCLEPRWKGPYQVVLTTTTAVKCAGIPNWIHASPTKKVACPLDYEEALLRVPISERQVSELEQRGTEIGSKPVEDCSVTPVRDEGEDLHEGPSKENTTEQGKGSNSTLKRTLTKDPLKGDKWPESQADRGKEVVVEPTIEEESIPQGEKI